jgi:hypothetical protein
VTPRATRPNYAERDGRRNGQCTGRALTPPAPKRGGDLSDGDTGRFTVVCRVCGGTVLSGVARVSYAETAELRAHLATCQPDLVAGAARNLGALLSQFDVRNAD